ncbi:Gfo/Idh/MocA family protein [Calycomorphotria hydatis]|uniref:Glycosyl hydrolase family 109 protein 1 n=1 Tax=Calycomorphotria hydatis TaxID=2528027 RepID=A0A517TCY2_9PLAN|nr:Gfo/Idh/MocA family oxidoreductase [Calycomorphotria hydatis]QDT66239.1 Glycosyl hydrolase family 109 protein 1 precursor [Calycomorphotria hydatis]
MNPTDHASPSRRSFLQTTVAAGVAASTLSSGVFAGGTEGKIRIGLVGCGGRGTGAALNALKADPGVVLVALADLFQEKIPGTISNLQKAGVGDRVQVPPEMQFSGLDAYKSLIDEVDVVLLATPPGFRPVQYRAAVEAGKHVFIEKPVAVDGPGIKHILETNKMAEEKGLVVVSGLCWRYDEFMRDMVQRVQDGQIGDVVNVQAIRHSGFSRVFQRPEGMADVEYQLRNWINYSWLSGDFMAEQFIHELDILAWAMGDKWPVSCLATGGRQRKVGPEWGNIYDHFNAVFEWEDGTRGNCTSRWQAGTESKHETLVYGTEGTANLQRFIVDGKVRARLKGKRVQMHQNEHNEMFAAIRAGEIIHNGEYMAKSTLMAIHAREAAYTGQLLTVDDVLNSKTSLGPEVVELNASFEPEPIAVPGVTRLV